jgi:transcriptional antiterminator RfaH
MNITKKKGALLKHPLKARPFFLRKKKVQEIEMNKSLSLKRPNDLNAMDVITNEDVVEPRTRSKKTVECKWYAIYTNPRAEKLVYQRLVEDEIETFLPLQKTFRVWSDRKKLIEKPLLPSYIFVNTTPKHFPKLYKIKGIVKLVSFEGKPVSIPKNQIDNLRLLVNSDADIEVTSENFAQGDNVEVVSGSLVGLTGELIRIGSRNRVVIRIDRLDQNLVVKIPKAFLRRV